MGGSLRRRLACSEDFRIVPVARDELCGTEECSERTIVVHAAWPPGAAGSWSDFLHWSKRLRASAADLGAWFVAFGSGIEAHAANPGLKEPYKSYARRKIEFKHALAASDPERFAWIRLHFMFGPGERDSRLVPAAIRAGLRDETFVCGSLDRRRRWLHVDDQAKYLADFLRAPQPGQWDIAGCHDVSFRDLLTLVGCAIDRKLRLQESNEAAPDSALAVIAPERMASIMSADAGDRASLLGRLREYAAELTGASTDC